MNAPTRAMARIHGDAPRPPTEIDIIVDGDFIVQLYAPGEARQVYYGPSRRVFRGVPLNAFKVDRDTLITNSPKFPRLIRLIDEEPGRYAIDIPKGTNKSVELCFRILHYAMTDDMYSLDIKEMWEALNFCSAYNIVRYHLDYWYGEWLYRRNLCSFNMDELRQLLYPIHEFNDARAFAFATRELVYELPQHITELNPTEHKGMHLDPRILENLNEARDGLKSKLMQAFFDPVKSAVQLTCPCKADSLASWSKAVTKSGIWPVEDVDLKSVQDVLEEPGTIHFMCTLPTSACNACKATFNPTQLHATRDGVLTVFRGLCLDCMARSKGDNGLAREDYWKHDKLQEWDKDCQVKHGQPTWFFSFMGDREEMKAHQIQMKNKAQNEEAE